MAKSPLQELRKMLEDVPTPAEPELAGQRLLAALAVRSRAAWEADMMALCIEQAKLGIIFGGGMEAAHA